MCDGTYNQTYHEMIAEDKGPQKPKTNPQNVGEYPPEIHCSPDGAIILLQRLSEFEDKCNKGVYQFFTNLYQLPSRFIERIHHKLLKVTTSPRRKGRRLLRNLERELKKI